MIKQFYFKQFNLACHLFACSSSQTVLLDPIKFFHSGQSGSGSNGSEGVHCIPQSSSITEASASDCLVSYLGHSLEESYPSAEMQSMYSTAPAEWALHSSNLCLVTWETLTYQYY